MAQNTVNFKQTMSGSVGAGMGAILNGSGRTYFILEHKVTSKYHKAGESQPIIIDNVTLGRDASCQVRFDDSFSTVSRKHAAIVKEGDNWVLVQLSQTNTTYLNGSPVKDRWYLKNGDEIQLSTNGPKLGFIVPQGEKSFVKSIGMTARLNLFRDQALRPYKTAVTAICVALVLVIAGGIFWGVSYKNKTDKNIVQMGENAQRQMDSIQNANLAQSEMERQKNFDNQVENQIDPLRKDVYFVITETYVSHLNWDDDVAIEKYTKVGTGFLLDDGRFVTARHCVEPWAFETSNGNVIYWNAVSNTMRGYEIYSKIHAISMLGEEYDLHFNSKDFHIDRSLDTELDIFGSPLDLQLVTVPAELIFRTAFQLTENQEKYHATSLSNDWAWIQTDKKGSIVADFSSSIQLKTAQKTHVLGFPGALGVLDGANRVEPIYSTMEVARAGLDKSGCIMTTSGTAHGNSGGPVFAQRLSDGKLVAVAIVSRLVDDTQQVKDGFITQQQQQYDLLVPIANINK